MEYLNILDKIDSHEEIGETWIEALIRSFNFPDSPRLFHTLVQLNNRVKEVIELYDSYSKGESSISSICNCSLPPIFNVWYFTTHFPIEKTRVVIILRTRTENSKNALSKISTLPTQLETHWSKQGVFLVRSYVSPECQQNDHNHNAWRVLTDTLIEYMANNNPDVLFVLVCQKKKKNDHHQYYHNTHNPLKYLEKVINVKVQ